MKTKDEAIIDDLFKIKGKAEIVNGEIVTFPPAGALPGYAAGEVFVSLHEYSRHRKIGHAVGANRAFVVNLPPLRSFSPNAAFYVGNIMMRYFEDAPVFAVEVRNEADYGEYAERHITQKRADYFAAGTRVVWDVDLLSDDVVRVYRASDPLKPTIYRRGEIAEAEPAVAEWTMPVDDLFPEW